MRDAGRWRIDTQGKDWQLRRVRKFPNEKWRYRYMWVHPNGGWHIELGTEKSAQFLELLRTSSEEFRAGIATSFDHEPLAQAIRAEGDGGGTVRYV